VTSDLAPNPESNPQKAMQRGIPDHAWRAGFVTGDRVDILALNESAHPVLEGISGFSAIGFDL